MATSDGREPPQSELSTWKSVRRLDHLVVRYVALTCVVLTVVVAGFFCMNLLHDRERAIDAEKRDALALLQFQIDEETGIRGYAATGQRSFLAPYFAGEPKLRATLASIQSGDPPTEEDAKALQLFSRLHDQWKRDVAARILADRNSPASETREQTGKTLVDGMRADIERVNVALAAKLDDVSRRAQIVQTGTALLALLSILIMGTYGYGSERRSAAREHALITSLMEARDSAARLSEWRLKIVAMFAHDFKSTLGVVRTYTHMLRDMPKRRSDPAIYRGIDGAMALLSSMADEALLMARITSDSLTVRREPVDVRSVLEEVATPYRGRREIRIGGSNGCVNGDPAYVRRIFDNLISNAEKYSPEHSPIDLRVERRPNGDMEIAVEDSGEGIHPDDLPHVFEEYWRAANAPLKTGTGVGLFIVKKIVEAHGGLIAVKSTVGLGTVVRVVLPGAAVSAAVLDRSGA